MCDAQVEVDVERVVVGDEGPRRRPSGDGVQLRRLHLHEPLGPQPLTQMTHDVTAQTEDLATALIGPQVDFALAIAHLDVADAAPLVAEASARAWASSSQLATFTDNSPRLVRTTSPVAPTQSPRLSRVNSSKRSVNVASANSCTDPEASRSSAKASLPCGQRQHHPAGHPDGDAGLLTGGERRPGVGHRGRLVRAVEAVRHLVGRAPGRFTARRIHGTHPYELTLRSYTMRRPCRVNQGSTCSMVSECGAMSELNPPVATTVDGPSSAMMRLVSPSTIPANP